MNKNAKGNPTNMNNSALDESFKELFFKFILIGDAGVGKTSILQRYIDNTFQKDYNVTVGAEFGSKFVEIDEVTRIKLQIWDTAGQESFSNIVRSFYKDSQGVFFVYNVNQRQTFENLKKWKESVVEEVDPSAIFVLIGNQVDLKEEREVSYEDAVKFMQDNGIHFLFETSALNGTNVELAFVEAAKLGFLTYLKERMTGQGSVFDPKHNNETLVLSARNNTKADESGCNC